ncbi:L,D-transpeptidase family protein [Labrys monachus]|uniref:Murein L,D-transpeptidase YcbB/YkuD n=1 Tax=Labrys monachus TaxID=217067 RepID=A0ABU0FCL4_9HYPH|nr:L,D-transpeptidase family protein [Labrys monachus]MDQ0392352.1 murein L,D-transpeptidase YcbB/YkuD [Labrys monachus]
MDFPQLSRLFRGPAFGQPPSVRAEEGRGRLAVFLGLLAALAIGSPAWADDQPNYSPRTYDLTLRAISDYEEIAGNGGWVSLPPSAQGLRLGARGKVVLALRKRLAITSDLDPALPASDQFDDAARQALEHFQARHGLSLTGSVGRLTLAALNVPVEERLHQLDASATRLAALKFKFGERYIVSNIPAASLEAVENGVVSRTYTTVVGSPDRASPTLQTRVTAVNILPYWNVPQSIMKADIMPKMVRDPNYLAENHMRVYRGGREIDPATIDWTGAKGTDFLVKQDPGVYNSLGFVRIDMPNPDAVYMHDSPHRDLFRYDVRFQSSGCTRVAGAQDLAAWVLEGTEWTGQAIQDQIDSGQPKTIKVPKPVPVAWVYLTGWGSPDGSVQFRPDVYSIDSPTVQGPATSGMATADVSDRTASVPVTAVRASAAIAATPN